MVRFCKSKSDVKLYLRILELHPQKRKDLLNSKEGEVQWPKTSLFGTIHRLSFAETKYMLDQVKIHFNCLKIQFLLLQIPNTLVSKNNKYVWPNLPIKNTFLIVLTHHSSFYLQNTNTTICKIYVQIAKIFVKIQLQKYSIPFFLLPVTTNSESFSSDCISQTWPIGFLQSF